MKAFFRRPFRWAVIYTAVLTLFVTYVLLDTFVIPRTGTPAVIDTTLSGSSGSLVSTSYDSSSGSSGTSQTTSSDTSGTSSKAVITASSYKDSNIQITIDTGRENDTNIYIADIQVSSLSYLKAAFANNAYGRNIRQTTSAMAEDNNALFAINGDYYGFRDYGYVLRNGKLYRSTARTSDITEDLVIDKSGNFSIIDETTTDVSTLTNAWQILSFGPALINNGKITVTADSEVDQSMTSNPRTAIGEISPLHYIVIVSDGRTSESAGLTLLQLAKVFQSRGCTVAYNLDGGGSSTMWFNGQIVNVPTDGHNNGERSVSDIVYIGY